MNLTVLWIAPVVPSLAPLSWMNELGRIQKIAGVTVRPLTGDKISLDDLALALNQPCDLVIFSGHGQAGGLILPDRTLIKTRWLAAQIARGCHPRVAILAACGSQERDVKLRSLTEAVCRMGINVIGFPAAAEDFAAATFTIEYVRAVALNTSLIQAFDVALETIADEATAAGVYFTPGISDLPFTLTYELAAIKDLLMDIRDRLGSNPPPSAKRTDATSNIEALDELPNEPPKWIVGFNRQSDYA